jgi:hypothetical protein
MAANWNEEEEEGPHALVTQLDSLSSYSPEQDTARLENLTTRLEGRVIDMIGPASDGKP